MTRELMPRASRRLARALLFASLGATLLLAGCDGTTETTCTEIGCGDGLDVLMSGTPGAEFVVIASAAGGETRNGNCTVQSDGNCIVAFHGFAPARVTLEVSGGSEQLTVTLEPAYMEFQPNGPGCPPICRQASIEIDLRPAQQH